MGLLILDCFCTELLFIFWSSDPCVVFHWTGAKWTHLIGLIYTNKTPKIHFLSSINASTVSQENQTLVMSSWDFTWVLNWTLIQNCTGTLRMASFLQLSPNTPISYNWDFRKALKKLTAHWGGFSILDLRFRHPSCFRYVSATAQLVQIIPLPPLMPSGVTDTKVCHVDLLLFSVIPFKDSLCFLFSFLLSLHRVQFCWLTPTHLLSRLLVLLFIK